MLFRIFTLFFIVLLCSPSVRANDELQGRIETNWRYGNERRILMTEFWIPVLQSSNNVIYADYRMMGDDHDARELNIGMGYRSLIDTPFTGRGVLGIHGWYDRRLTPRRSKFNQITTGLEWFGQHIDWKLNSYIPLNDKKTHYQPNPNGTDGRFVGNQIVVNTDQTVIEEALTGIDFELGWNVPYLAELTDSTRVYAGAYHFDAEQAEDVSGWRTRISSDITSDLQFGARFQKDDVRGSQGFLELTVRFPFNKKKSFRRDGVRARLDESPERDIDIVSNEIITDNGNNRVLLNSTTGEIQNIIHVDSGAGGDGSAETPFNTLAAAELAASDNDLIYVHGGGVPLTGGITLDDVGQRLIGSGVDLVFSGERFSTPNALGLSASNTIISATTAPTITNAGGHGVLISSDRVEVSGITVDGAAQRGIYALNNSGTSWSSVYIHDVNSVNNANDGIRIETTGAGSDIVSAVVENATSSNNQNHGFFLFANSDSQIINADLTSLTSMNNQANGVYVFANNSGQIDNANLESVTSTDSQNHGLFLFASNNGIITDVTLSSSSSTNSQANGVYVFANNNGQINNATLEAVTSTNNQARGLFVLANSNGILGGTSVERSIFTDNTTFGVEINDDTTNTFIVDLGVGALGSTGQNTIHSNTGDDLNVDLDGITLKAENNWWGDASGLDPLEINSGSDSVDFDPFLLSPP